ncbi:hypothetical protein AB0I77_53125 [Streptomyces sp. NPDC050619]|uniref:hypothetical protein n=1 Tax=Streptomyces sp. NPDC050619 TaxID=3157214 RepID=UPI0034222C7A
MSKINMLMLTELKKWDATPPEDWFDVDGEQRQWGRFIRHLLRQLEAAVADPRQSS